MNIRFEGVEVVVSDKAMVNSIKAILFGDRNGVKEVVVKTHKVLARVRKFAHRHSFTEEENRLVIQYHKEGKQYKEIASMLGMNPLSVQSKIWRLEHPIVR